MNQQPDAAGRVQAYLDARDQLITAGATLADQIAEAKSGGSPWARLLMADLREVLAELADAKQQLDALKTERCIQFHDAEADRWRTSEFATLDDAIETEGGELEWRAAERLVGEWTEASDGEAA